MSIDVSQVNQSTNGSVGWRGRDPNIRKKLFEISIAFILPLGIASCWRHVNEDAFNFLRLWSDLSTLTSVADRRQCCPLKRSVYTWSRVHVLHCAHSGCLLKNTSNRWSCGLGVTPFNRTRQKSAKCRLTRHRDTNINVRHTRRSSASSSVRKMITLKRRTSNWPEYRMYDGEDTRAADFGRRRKCVDATEIAACHCPAPRFFDAPMSEPFCVDVIIIRWIGTFSDFPITLKKFRSREFRWAL